MLTTSDNVLYSKLTSESSLGDEICVTRSNGQRVFVEIEISLGCKRKLGGAGRNPPNHIESNFQKLRH